MCEPREAVCEWCGQVKPDVRETRDPYLAEVWEEIILVDICGDCFDQRWGDI